jgi:hypothetical protein
MSKTNFDDLDLAVPGIEADEINTEGVTAGQVLMADGAGSAAWGKGGAALMRLMNDTEDTFASGSWMVLTNLVAEIQDPGFSLDEASGEISIGPELDGKVLTYQVTSGIWAATQTGYYNVQVQVDEGGVGVWKSAGNDHHQVAVTSSDMFHVIASGFTKLSAGDKYRIRVNLNLTPAGTADFDLNHSTVALVAF